MALNLDDELSFEVVISGQKHNLKKLTMGQAMQIERVVSGAEKTDKSPNEITTEFLMGAGLPKEVVMGLSLSAVNKLTRLVMGGGEEKK